MNGTTTTMASLPCYPDMAADDACDVPDFHYRLNCPVTLPEETPVLVEVKLHFRLTGTPGCACSARQPSRGDDAIDHRRCRMAGHRRRWLAGHFCTAQAGDTRAAGAHAHRVVATARLERRYGRREGFAGTRPDSERDGPAALGACQPSLSSCRAPWMAQV